MVDNKEDPPDVLILLGFNNKDNKKVIIRDKNLNIEILELEKYAHKNKHSN